MERLLNINFERSSEIQSNDVLKVFAIIFMLIDHIGAIFFPKILILRAIGRLAFPIFAYGIAIGYQHTKNLKLYLLRLSLFLLLSQPFFTLVFKDGINIFATLLLGLLAIYFYDKKQYLTVVLLLIVALTLNINYGLYGVGMILTFHIFKEHLQGLVVSQIIINILFGLHYHTFLQSYSLLSLILIYKKECFINVHLNKRIGYMFYPTHLGLIALIAYLK